MCNRLLAHVLGAVQHRVLRSETSQSAAASASVGAASQATHAGSSNHPASSLQNPWAIADFGTTLHMCNRWRDHVSGAEDEDLGHGSSDDDSSNASSPQSSADASAFDVIPEDEPFKEDEKVVAEWRMKSLASSTIVRILCCLIVICFCFQFGAG
jgi:hypothetical protein